MLELCTVFVVDIIVDLVRGMRCASTVSSQNTLGESVLILFIVVQGLLSLVHDLLDQVFTLSSLVVEGRVNRVDRVVHLLVEHRRHQSTKEGVSMVNYRVRIEFLL